MAALQYLAPDFIKEDRLCWLRSPLYIVDNKGKKSFYFNDKEFDAVRKTVKGTVTRAKGLGKLSPEVAHASMFTEEYQRLDVLKYDGEAINLLCDLMGDDVKPRKEFIMKNIDFHEVRE